MAHRSRRRVRRFRTDPVAPWWWADQKRFARSEVLRHLDPRDLNAQFPQPSLDLAGMRASFERNILPVLAAHPGTEFDLVWPPYSIIVWGDYVQRQQLDVTLAFKRYVFDATRALPNVHVIDLQGVAGVTHDLDRYTDLYHFAPPINDWLIDAACHGRHRVRADNVDTLDRQLRAQALRASIRPPQDRLTSAAQPRVRRADPFRPGLGAAAQPASVLVRASGDWSRSSGGSRRASIRQTSPGTVRSGA
jgi:hypothetical protein